MYCACTCERTPFLLLKPANLKTSAIENADPMSKLPLAHARVVGAYAQTAVNTALAGGMPPSQVAALLAINEDALGALPESLPAARYLALLNGAARALKDPHFGLHVGEHMKLASYAVYGLVVMSCRTFGAAMQQVMRFESLAHDLGRSHLRVDGGIAIYEWHSTLAAQAAPHLAESVFAGIITFVRWLAQRPIPVVEMGFPHPAPANLLAHQRLFAAPVRFDTPLAYARFDASLLDWPMPNADASLFPLLSSHAETLLAERQRQLCEPEIVVLVKQQIATLLTQDGASLAAIASQLRMSPRTLQRRLSAAGSHFQQLLDATRRELAAGYLGQPELSLTEIAFMLGFSEQSSFSHAFRDWYGMTPAGFRAGRLAAR